MLKVPLENPQPNIDSFVKVIRGDHTPAKPPLVELFIDYEALREISISHIGRRWVEPGRDRASREAYLKNWMEVYWRLGYDYVRVTGGLDFPGKQRIADDTAGLSRGQRAWAEEGTGTIASWEDYENYSWPSLDNADLSDYEFVAQNLPEGMGLCVCPTSGFLEIPLDKLLGYQNLCYLLYDDPKLVEAVFQRVGELIYGFYKKVLGLPNLAGFFQGDDMGFKTGTLIGVDHIRKLVLPWHTKLAELAHSNGLVYLLHSCGNLEQLCEDLLNEVKIDGRHSYEDEGNSVFDFKRKYGHRTAVLGGVDVHKLASLQEDDLRAYVRRVIEECSPGGRFAVGSGNTVCNYVPIPNYFAMLDVALNFGS